MVHPTTGFADMLDRMKYRYPIAIDIDDHILRMAQLRETRHGLMVGNLIRYPLEARPAETSESTVPLVLALKRILK